MTFLPSKRIDVERILALLPPDLQARLATMEVDDVTTIAGKGYTVLASEDFDTFLDALVHLARTVDPGAFGIPEGRS